jgi:hypothetical protein
MTEISVWCQWLSATFIMHCTRYIIISVHCDTLHWHLSTYRFKIVTNIVNFCRVVRTDVLMTVSVTDCHLRFLWQWVSQTVIVGSYDSECHKLPCPVADRYSKIDVLAMQWDQRNCYEHGAVEGEMVVGSEWAWIPPMGLLSVASVQHLLARMLRCWCCVGQLRIWGLFVPRQFMC